jgi:glucosamine-6-phosphate deaminase
MSFTETKTGETTFNKDMLVVKIFPTREEMGKKAAEDVSKKINELLKQKPEINMIFAAAPSQNEFLKHLSEDSSIPWNKINAFHMDEYIGLDKNAPQAFGNFLKDRLFGKVPFKNVYYLNGQAKDLSYECKRYAELLRKNPIDIVCLGIGENGHIAFNDPSVADFNDPEIVKIVELEEKSRQQQVHDQCFADIDSVPKKAFTITIPGLLKADYMFCIVPSKLKAEAVYKTLNDPVSEKCPATILRRKKGAILYLDKESASLLQLNSIK